MLRILIQAYSKSNFLIFCEQIFLRAFLAVSAEEESLPAMIADALVDLTLQISALSITLQYARLKVLLEPIGIGQR